MTEKKKDFLINLASGGVIAVLVFILGTSRGYETTRNLCDAAFVTAALMLGLGGLKAIRNQGIFDVMGFGVKSTVELFIPILKRGEKEDLYAYRERKESERKSAVGMLMAGAVYLVLSVILLIIYFILN